MYDRNTAVLYALKYGLNPNPSYKYMKPFETVGGDCSNFISQCLKAGGAPMAFGTLKPWWYERKGTNNVSDDTWSLSWTVANSLYLCLKVRYEKKIWGLSGMEVDDINMLEEGDIIQYENSKGVIYHSAIITSFQAIPGGRAPLITQHSYDAVNITYIKPKASRMHLMKIIVT